MIRTAHKHTIPVYRICVSVLLPERFGGEFRALHLRHTTQCVLQRVLSLSVSTCNQAPETINPSVGKSHFPKKLQRNVLFY